MRGSWVAVVGAAAADVATVAPARAQGQACFGESPTIMGAPEAATLTGTPRPDVIAGRIAVPGGRAVAFPASKAQTKLVRVPVTPSLRRRLTREGQVPAALRAVSGGRWIRPPGLLVRD